MKNLKTMSLQEMRKTDGGFFGPFRAGLTLAYRSIWGMYDSGDIKNIYKDTIVQFLYSFYYICLIKIISINFMEIIVTILFMITDIILYFFLAKKYNTYNIFKISKYWLKEYF